MNRLKQALLAAALEPVQATGPDSWRGRFCFAEDFVGFAGHFPGYPILPAVVQVLAAVSVAEAACGRPLQLTALENAKFLLQLRPGEAIEVQCRAKAGLAGPAWEGKLQVAAGLASSFTLQFEGQEETPC